MDSPASRLTAALLTQHPGSELLPSALGPCRVRLATAPPQEVVIIEDQADAAATEAQLAGAVASAVLGKPLNVVLLTLPHADRGALVRAHVPSALRQRKAMTGWTWVPGELPVKQRGFGGLKLGAATRLADSGAGPTLETAATTAQHEAGEVSAFNAALAQRRPVVTWTVAAVCCAFFGLQWLWGDGLPLLAARHMGGEVPRLVFAGEWWRLWSVMLLHLNVAHLAMNMVALLSFGTFLERLVGSGRYLVLYVLSGVGGSLLSLTHASDTLSVGASGGIWGLMLAGAVLVTVRPSLYPSALAVHLRRRAWTPVVLNLVYSLQPGIDLRAHLGGGLAGGLLILLLTRGAQQAKPLPNSRSATAGGALAALSLAAAMALALIDGRPWALSQPWRLAPAQLEGTLLRLRVPEPLKVLKSQGVWKWGELNADGVEVIVVLEDQFPEGMENSEALDQAIKTWAARPLPNMHYRLAPRRSVLPSGREVATFEQLPDRKDDPRVLRGYGLVEDHRLVTVLTNTLNSVDEARRGQLLAVVDSVSAASGP